MSVQGPGFQQHNNLRALASMTGDAITWGAIGGAVGAGISLVSQHKILKNPEKLIGNIANITDTLVMGDLNQSKRKSLTHALDCLKKGKINYKGVAKTGLTDGCWWAIPTLALNALIYAGKTGYDKIRHHNS